MSNAGNEYTDKQIEELEKELTEVYSRAGDELEKKASAYFARFEKEDKEKQRLVKDGKMSETDYNKWRTGSMMTGQRWKTLKEQSAKTLLEANKNAVKLANGKLPSIYMFNYNETGKDAQDALKGISFDLINERALARMLKDKTTVLPFKEVDGKKVERWDTRKINAEVTQGIIQGESMDKIAKRFRNVSEMDKRYSLLNARTAMTGAENRGTLDGMQALEEDGVILLKVWMSAHDRRVRKSHQHIDGESVPVKEEFSNGLMYPGDPDGDPEEVYGCRCTMVTNVVGFRNPNANRSLGNLVQPERPRKTDYDDEEKFARDRAEYKVASAEYNKRIDEIVDSIMTDKAHYTNEELERWANQNGITMSSDLFEKIDSRIVDEARPVLNELFARYPEVKSYSFESFDGSIYKTGFNIGVDNTGIMSAGFGINFNSNYFPAEGDRAAMGMRLTIAENLGTGFNVRGDGTFGTIVRHEYGHNVQSYIEEKMAQKYHYHVDDWRKHYSSFNEYEKARNSYWAEKKQYDKELLSLAGLKGSSEYSNTNEYELFAEGFAEYTSGGKTEFGEKFGDFLKRWYY